MNDIFRTLLRSADSVKLYGLLFLCVVFYHIGPNYHLSFGSLGMLLVAVIAMLSVDKFRMISAIFFVSAFFLSVLLYVYFYDDEQVLRAARMAILAFVLVISYGNFRLRHYPPKLLLWAGLMLVVGVTVYQAEYNILYRIPHSILAMASIDHEFLVATDLVDGYVYRPPSIYLEPSAAAMILWLLALHVLDCPRKERSIYLLFVGVGLIYIRSGLGFVAMLGLFAYFLINSRGAAKYVFLAVCSFFILPFIYEFIGQRVDSGGISALARIIYPFALIKENVENWDLLGYPGDAYNHFWYTGLYASAGEYPGHNGILSLIISFGFVGMILLIWMLFQCSVGGGLGLFTLLIIASQSGNFLSYEKVFLMVYGLALCVKLRRSASVETTEKNYLKGV